MSYKLLDKPKKVTWTDGPVMAAASLADEYGGEAHIIPDDKCYVLLVEKGSKKVGGEKAYISTCWWFKEAVEALKDLPLPS